MPPQTIENPILNSPFVEPGRHFKFDDDGITNEILESRRPSSYFVPIPAARKKGKKQLDFGTEWTGDRVQENDFINRVRQRVGVWRQGGYAGVTRQTRELLEYWRSEDRERRLFFAQVEALETLIYITEVANKYGDQWIENTIREGNADANPLLYRQAIKMATGTGKTVVMAMIIAWHTLNKLANSQDARFTDSFLVVTPGITIKDRLRVLQPNVSDNFYQALDLVPPGRMPDLLRGKILVTNFHAFLLREKGEGSRLTKRLSGQEATGVNKETPAEMVRRVLRDFGNKKNIVVLNDEAHHCYRRRPDAEDDEAKLKGEEKDEAKKRNEEARIWISGLEAVKAKVGIKAIYDLSATPFFLRGSGYGEGTLFPWVVSDFSLVDAIEAGVVKVPRVPISDDAMDPVGPTYRELWLKIRQDLPKKGARTEKIEDEPKLPAELEGALLSLYGNYEKSYRHWEQTHHTQTPPVFIVVCNNTNVSRLVYRWISGWEKPIGDNGETVVVPGKLDVFNNERDGAWIPRPNTILIDSAELDSGESLSPEFKRAADVEIREFKDYLRQRTPGIDIEKVSDEDLLREVMNTVGKPGRLGEQIKCVVSVSMLTEGWDANTVTHILGVRAFGTQLLCEQVVGRGLRRMSYAVDENDMFTAEYAEVYGVPFSFIPASGSPKDPKPARPTTRVRALEERIEKEITFPRVIGYKYEIPEGRLLASFTAESQFSLSPQDVPTEVEIAAIAGEQEIHRLDDLKSQRLQTVAFTLARETLKKYFSENGDERPWLFPQLLDISRRWLEECVTTRGNAFKQLLLMAEFREHAIDRIYRSIVGADPGPKRLKPILRPYDVLGSTRYVAFDTTKSVWTTDADKCHISHVTADSNWEHVVARELEGIEGVDSYVKNQGLNFTIPYTHEGEERQYHPDYIVRLLRPNEEEPLNVIIEVTGQGKRDKQAKVDTARTLWIPAVNNHGGFGRWDFIEVTDPYEAAKAVRALAAGEHAAVAVPTMAS